MALSVIKRPIALRIIPTTIQAALTFDVSNIGGQANFNLTSHGLLTGDYIYVVSDCSEYNGFWYIQEVDANNIRIREYATASNVSFYPYKTANRTATVYECYNLANINAVHNPIVYKLASTAWPTNSVDTARTVSSYANDLGYVKLTLSGDIKSDVTELEFVKVTFTGGESEVYQILTWYSNSIVTIDLPYIGGITFVSVQYYYQNYHAKIKIFAGLVSTHTYADQKPFEEICEIKAVPDDDGVITININEYLKSKINIISNNLNLGSIPNDIDSFCQFYISVAEAYSYSAGGYTLLDFVSSYTSDLSNGNFYALNASMPFKNIYSGMMSEYAADAPSYILTQKFLTPSAYPVLRATQSRTLGPVSQFFDISFFRVSAASLRMKREVYSNGTIVNLYLDSIIDVGVGVYRYEVDRSVYLEDRIDLTVQLESGGTWFDLSETKTITVDDSCGQSDTPIDLSWKNYLGGHDYWRFKEFAEFGADATETTEATKNIFPTWPNSWGEDADTVRYETSRKFNQTVTVVAENLTEDQLEDLFRIKLSPLVQVVNSRSDRRTVIPDKSSFTYFKQGDKVFSFQMKFNYTDDLPSQSQ